ncbi:MAG: hypothetical protein ACI9MR_001697 [Myxococcota bacterium]|jgi:hypothetical protein
MLHAATQRRHRSACDDRDEVLHGGGHSCGQLRGMPGRRRHRSERGRHRYRGRPPEHPEADEPHAPLLRGVRTRPLLALSGRSSAAVSEGDGSTGRAPTSGTNGMGRRAEADLRHRRSALRVLRRPPHGGLRSSRPGGRPGDHRRGRRCGHASRAAPSPGMPGRSPRSSEPLTTASHLTPPALANPAPITMIARHVCACRPSGGH